jgi:hypothetical protein
MAKAIRGAKKHVRATMRHKAHMFERKMRRDMGLPEHFEMEDSQ